MKQGRAPTGLALPKTLPTLNTPSVTRAEYFRGHLTVPKDEEKI